MPNGDHSQSTLSPTSQMVEGLLDKREARIRELEAENEELKRLLAVAVGQRAMEETNANQSR